MRQLLGGSETQPFNGFCGCLWNADPSAADKSHRQLRVCIAGRTRELARLGAVSRARRDAMRVDVLEGVRAQQTLTALDLSSCAIGDGGAEAVARELEANGALRFARVASNEIGADGGRALADAVDASPCETLLLDVTQNPRVAYSDLVRVRLSNCARAAAAGPNPLDGAGRADPYVS